MSMKRKAMQITLPRLVNDFLHDLMAEMGFNKSELIESMVFFVSMPENMTAFKNQYVLGDAGEDDDDDNDDNGDNDEEEDDDADEDEDEEEEE